MKKLATLVLLITVISFQTLYANNILSSYLQYTSTSKGIINTTLKVNTECEYGDLSGMQGVIYNDINSDSFVFSFIFKSERDATLKCHLGEKSYCEDPIKIMVKG